MTPVLQLVFNIISILLVGGGLLTVFTLREKKLVERQNVRKAENDADAGKFTNLERRVKFAEEAVIKLNERLDVSDRKIEGQQRLIHTMTSIVIQNDIFHCDRIGCTTRDPELGTYHTVIPKCSDCDKYNQEGCMDDDHNCADNKKVKS